MFGSLWFEARVWCADRAWAAREARRCYRAAVAYCAACREEAEAHCEWEATRPKASEVAWAEAAGRDGR